MATSKKTIVIPPVKPAPARPGDRSGQRSVPGKPVSGIRPDLTKPTVTRWPPERQPAKR
jgi:hypothetical protein